MKKMYFIFLTILITGVLVNCSDTANDVSEEFLALKSPNDFVIANSIDELEAMLLSSIEKKFEPNVYFEITKISYLDVESGVVANIDYITGSGEESNIILMKDFPYKVICNAKKMNGLYEDNSKGGGWSFSCSGEECCKVHAVRNLDGSVDIDCSCAGCTMTIEPTVLPV